MKGRILALAVLAISLLFACFEFAYSVVEFLHMLKDLLS
jgi:hypothetical protein